MSQTHRRTDGQTDRQTTYCGITALCIASRGKNRRRKKVDQEPRAKRMSTSDGKNTPQVTPKRIGIVQKIVLDQNLQYDRNSEHCQKSKW